MGKGLGEDALYNLLQMDQYGFPYYGISGFSNDLQFLPNGFGGV